MAKLNMSGKKTFTISRFLGSNECEDGDTSLKLGEASKMRNFKITPEYALQKRPGTKNVAGLLSEYIVDVSEDEEILNEEVVTSTATFLMKPNVSVTETGLLFVSGESGTMNYANHSDFVGQYYEAPNGKIYKFVDCVYDEGAGQYRWSKHNCTVSSYSYYTLSWKSAGDGSPFYNPSGFTGSTGYSFNQYTGQWTNTGSTITIVNSGTIYGSYNSATALGGGYFSMSIATKNGPYYDTFYTKGSTFLGYVYGSNNDYPNGSYKYDSTAGTNYWYSEKVPKKLYKWTFQEVKAASNTNDKVVRGIWSGYVAGKEYIVAACNGYLWSLTQEDGVWQKTNIGTIDTTDRVHFFGYDEKLYILNGQDYLVWDGENSATSVTGYRPLVAIATPPAGGGTLLEQVNKLTASKRQQFSPNGTAKDFQLLEKDITSVDFVKVNGVLKTLTTDYTINLLTGVVSFVTAPATGINTVEIGWTGKSDDRDTVLSMRFSEFYNGVNDNRVFLYGNGTNKAIYSGLDEHGNATAEYFPDLNEVLVGDENTPITGMVRHYDSLLAFKLDSAYRINYNTLTLADDTMTAGFYVKPVNRGIGNSALGQALLVENNARTLDGRSLYEWVSSGGYLTNDQRNAQRVSQRVEKTLRGMKLEDAITYFDKINHEYYVIYDGIAIVQNTELDVWYVYDNFPATCMIVYADEVYIGDSNGYLRHVHKDYRNDNGTKYACVWESGSMDFDRNTYEKMMHNIHVTMQPDTNCRIYVDLQTEIKASYTDNKPLVISFGILDFAHIDFDHFSFNTNHRLRNETVKFKASKFVYAKLILTLDDEYATATLPSISIPVIYTGEAR